MSTRVGRQPDDEGMAERRQIIVLGMHRSGTSATTAVLSACGAYVGAEEELVAKSPENPQGFFERRDARKICDRLLHSASADWWKVRDFNVDLIPPRVLNEQNKAIKRLVEELDGHGVWALKEPRLCLLLPVFQRHLKNPVVVFVSRHPFEVAQSLRRRNGIPRTAGLALWEAYVTSALRHSANMPRAFLSYSDLVTAPRETTAQLVHDLKRLGVAGLNATDQPFAVNAGLRHERVEGSSAFEAMLSPTQRTLWTALVKRDLQPLALGLPDAARLNLEDFEIDRALALKDEKTKVSLAELKAVQATLATTEREARAHAKQAEAVAKAEVEMERSRAERAETRAQDAAQDLGASKERLSVMGRELEAARVRLEQRDRRISELSGVLENTQNKLGRAETRAQDAARDLGASKERLSVTGHELKAVRVRLEQRDRRISEISSALENTQDKLGRTDRELTQLRKLRSKQIGPRVRALLARMNIQNAVAARRIAKSGLFDARWYRAQYPAAAASNLPPLLHFVIRGRTGKYDPNPMFDSAWYLAATPDAAKAAKRGGNPLLHYLATGAKAGRDPSPLFDARWYLERYPDVAKSGCNPLAHYLSSGAAEGRDPNPMFDARWYLDRNPDVAASGMNPFMHYLSSGAAEGRNPHPEFDSRWYLERYRDVAASGMNPLLHYLRAGMREGRKINPHGSERKSQSEYRAPSLDAVLPSQARQTVFRELLEKLTEHDFPRELAEALKSSRAEIESVTARLRRHRAHPLVSIIMPTHNRASILGDAIASVIDQDYQNWELIVCDDGGTDETESVVDSFHDARIRYLKLAKGGAAAARNAGLAQSRGEVIAYLDSDNYWRAFFLTTMVLALLEAPGRSAVYADYIDFVVDRNGKRSLKAIRSAAFHHERLLEKPYIDLNSFVHRRELYDCFGGFNEALTRRQDYDLILKYTWLRDPLHVPLPLTLYQRNENLKQITTSMSADTSCIPIINGAVASYFTRGLPLAKKPAARKVTILSWDLCRNHFSKPFALAEALSEDYDVQLISFRFFEEEIFPPLAGVEPPFETIYLPGANFPDFFDAMEKAVEAIRGDIIYVVKPRLPSLGVALLANYRREIPIVLEINDLETVVSAPKSEDRHLEAAFDSIDLSAPELIIPYSDLWSQLMDPIAKQMPVLLTHNKGIDEHFGNRCLYMRNLKDERVYDPGRYDRAKARADLRFSPDDRVILFGGLLRKHKGIYELIELVERLNDSRYKLLFVGSRPTPDQKRMVEKYGERVRVLPPQDREAMARINLAADIVVLWLDPDVPASHYQMPYKATDALAMGASVIANDISDLGELARQGYIRLAPYGNWERMAEAIRKQFADLSESDAMRAAGRRLYQRQFSYAAARSNFALAAGRAFKEPQGVLPAARAFVARFNAFYREVSGADRDFTPQRTDLPTLSAPNGKDALEEGAADIELVDVRTISTLTHDDPGGVAVVMPCIDTEKGMAAARLLRQRARMRVRIFVVEDTLRQGFIRTLNETAARLNVKYIVYLAEDAFPGVDWLKMAYETLERTGKGLLAFNCGKWKGRIAAFGMVRMSWIAPLYGGPIFFPGYKAHKADNELTVIARMMDQFVYAPDCALVEYDPGKAFRRQEGGTENWTPKDRQLFYERFHSSFDGLFRWRDLKPMKDEYLNQRKLRISDEASDALLDEGEAVEVLDVRTIADFSYTDAGGVAVIMPCIDTEKGLNTARLLQKRAGMSAKYLVVEDTLRQGFIKTLNESAAQVSVKYIVYLAEDAFPGADWLKTAYETLERTGKGLLAFNCGKWRGRIAAFGMVRTNWGKVLYGGPVFFEGYKTHRADNELTVIARAADAFVYSADAVLIELDAKKAFRKREADAANFDSRDRQLFIRRFHGGFDELIDKKLLEPMSAEYSVPMNKAPVEENAQAASPLPAGREGGDVRRFRAKPLTEEDVSTLKQEYKISGLEATADEFVLYRIVGNDLPPRHKIGQTRDNLRFILENESRLEGCEKRFVINRICNPDEERAIINLLEAHGAEYLRLPFDADEYRRVGFDLSVLPTTDFLSSARVANFERAKKERLALALYRLKNNYVMNNNGARNAALRDGRRRGKWVLPFDGNCFFTEAAWDNFRKDVEAAPYLKYFIVPMTRAPDNARLVSETFIPDPVEEPQVAFRQDAKEEFNETFCYGRRPKVELLWRLGVAGKWDRYRFDPWDQPRRPQSREAGRFGVAGWVARLFSGMGGLEAHDKPGADGRYFARAEAIVAALNALDTTFGLDTDEDLELVSRLLSEPEKSYA